MAHDASPTARALLALELLQAAPGMTATRLGDALGVTERAARRYVEILREAGIPVESVRGPYGGYRVGRGHRLPPLLFTSTEALGLVMAVLDGHHAANDPLDPVGAAVGKLVRALPEPVAAQAEAVRRGTSPAPDRAAARPDPATTTALVDACGQRRQVRLTYRSRPDAPADRAWVAEAEPWAVVVRHGRWYLLCRVAAGLRTLRIDRVSAVETLDTSFVPPADLDPVAVLEENLSVGWEHEVEVVVDAPLDVVRRWLPRSFGRLEALGEGATRLTASTSDPDWYAAQLVLLPAPYRIVGDDAVRASARALGRRLADAGGV